MVKVKICGITSLEDAQLAAAFGAEMLGFNFYLKSKRYVLPEKVRGFVEHIDDSIIKVGVFVNPSVEEIAAVRTTADLDAIQLHGDETTDFIAKLREKMDVRIIKAVRVGTEIDLDAIRAFGADDLLLDAFSPAEYGGTGRTFDWKIIGNSPDLRANLFLAGGLIPDNVAEAIRTVRPYAVDVASGVESSPGKKDPKKLEAFIRNAKNA